MKAYGDYLFAGLALILFFPSALVISLLIKLDSAGPVFVRQRYRGVNGKVIGILKFRTVAVPKYAEGVTPLRPVQGRITRMGHFLRQTRLDELPMLINVLTGDMSLAGPEPLPEASTQRYQEKPGVVWRYTLEQSERA